MTKTGGKISLLCVVSEYIYVDNNTLHIYAGWRLKKMLMKIIKVTIQNVSTQYSK